MTLVDTTQSSLQNQVVLADPTPPLLPRVPSWRTLLGLILAAVAITGFCAEVAYLVSDAQPRQWEARSQIEYRGEAWVETAAEELSSQSRIRQIADANGIPIKRFTEDLRAGAVPGTQILQYGYIDHDANLALRVVDQLTQSYLADPDTSLSERVTRIETTVARLESQLEVAIAELEAVAAPPGSSASAAERVAEADVNRLADLLGESQGQLLAAELEVIAATDREPAVITEPFVLQEPAAPRPKQRAALGALAGLALSSILAALVLSRDPAR